MKPNSTIDFEKWFEEFQKMMETLKPYLPKPQTAKPLKKLDWKKDNHSIIDLRELIENTKRYENVKRVRLAQYIPSRDKINYQPI